MSYVLPGNDTERQSLPTTDPSHLTHRQLIQQLALQPRDNLLWQEFKNRYDQHLRRTIFIVCQRKSYAGLATPDDFVAEVYQKLMENDNHRLREFTGRFENSIFDYLKIVAINVVLNGIRHDRAKKRPPASQRVSLPEDSPEHPQNLVEFLPSPEALRQHEMIELQDAIEFCLNRILVGKKHGQRDKLVFKLHYFKDFSAEQLAQLPAIKLSAKRIYGLLKLLLQKVRDCLRKQW
ncbi:MAG: hypothetical protein ONB48_08115 [candidate division KSB1 bacterium]|nr:hypothetical protein [candidate division KSB1 bacterium]MDZ7274788.1 hypothetical protein [candidate division KSB1 bacterium]MDZ7285612.1 hypothetical protein [candidate division KSB1 bacterium]MDZ7298644.1 hypothetical protein [candidate division KSB1 bacterium]MDZ7307484.1 hypothetical protein [candidate division KSB1 bacterium]